jgi:hypothetical protein
MISYLCLKIYKCIYSKEWSEREALRMAYRRSHPTSKPAIFLKLSGYALPLSFNIPARRRQTCIGYNKCSACGKPGCFSKILFRELMIKQRDSEHGDIYSRGKLRRVGIWPENLVKDLGTVERAFLINLIS